MDKLEIEPNKEITINSLDEFSSEKINLTVGENSILNLNILNIGKTGKLEVNCKRNSVLNFNFLITESKDLDLVVNLDGQNSQANVKGGYILNGSTLNISTVQNHLNINTVSDLDIRGILNNSVSNYKGNIFIDKKAQFSNAGQINKNILLDENSGAVSVPSLEVLSDDVKCAHGSAVAPIDKDFLYYSMSRGLTLSRARLLMLKSFFIDLRFCDSISENIDILLDEIEFQDF